MPYNLKSFVRKLPPEAFKNYLETKLKIDTLIIENIDWSSGKTKYTNAIDAMILGFSRELQAELNDDFEKVFIITENDTGEKSLESAILFEENKQLSIQYNQIQEPLSSALYLLINYYEVFQTALHYYFADRFNHGKRHGCYKFPIDKVEMIVRDYTDKKAQDAFKEAITKTVRKKDLLAKIHIEWIKRQIDNDIVYQGIIYKENAPKGFQTFEDDELDIKFLRLVTEACIKYNPKTGCIDIISEGGKDQHEAILNAFQEHLIVQDEKQEIIKIPPKNINFDFFREKPNFSIPHNHKVAHVSVTGLRFNLSNSEGFGQITLSDKTNIINRDVYYLLKPYAKNKITISQVTLCFTIKETDEEDEHSISFDLTYPNKSNLASLCSKYQKDIEDLLIEWGIYQDATD